MQEALNSATSFQTTSVVLVLNKIIVYFNFSPYCSWSCYSIQITPREIRANNTFKSFTDLTIYVIAYRPRWHLGGLNPPKIFLLRLAGSKITNKLRISYWRFALPTAHSRLVNAPSNSIRLITTLLHGNIIVPRLLITLSPGLLVSAASCQTQTYSKTRFKTHREKQTLKYSIKMCHVTPKTWKSSIRQKRVWCSQV